MGALVLPLPGLSGVDGFTSTRQGGVSQGDFDSLNLGLNTQDDPAAVHENRRRAFARLGRKAGEAVYLQQVHGAQISEALAGHAGRGSQSWDQGLPACDAVWTRVQGLPLAIGHADCLAVVLADAEAGLLGLAHAGWRGALAGLPGLLAQELIRAGASPGRLRAALSPCLGPTQLQLSDKEAALFQAAFGGLEGYASPVEAGHFYLDLWSLTRRQLLAQGLSSTQIQAQAMDTASLPELFFSHRRDQGRTGRMLTAAWLK